MKQLMSLIVINKIKIISIIALPPLVLSLVTLLFYDIFSKNIGILYYPISFGVTFGLFNWNRLRYDTNSILKSVFLSLFLNSLMCFVSFFVALSVIFLFQYIESFLQSFFGEDFKNVIILVFAICIITPITLFSISKIIHKIKINLFTFLVEFISIFLLVIIFLNAFRENVLIRNIEKVNHDNPFVLWIFIMALSIQLIIYHRDLRNIL